MHQQSMAGIDGREDCGCYSIVLSAGYVIIPHFFPNCLFFSIYLLIYRYEDDEDNGEEIVYTGCGGQNPTTKLQEKGVYLGGEK